MPSLAGLQDHPGVVPSRTLLVELAGTPGAGKTTALPEIHDVLQQAGWVTVDPEEGARTAASRTFPGRTVDRFTSGRVRQILMWRVYLLYRLVGTGRAILTRPGHFLWVTRRQTRRPKEARARGRRVLYWYLRMAGAQEFYRSHARRGEAVVFDEGHVHRVVQLFSSPADQGRRAEIGHYLQAVPRPDLLIHVDTPVESCLERVRGRGVWERLEGIGDDGLERFIQNADRVVRMAVEWAESEGWNVVRVDNSDPDVSALRPKTVEALDRAVPLPSQERSTTPRHRLAVPRPRQLALLARGRLGTTSLPTETVDAFLGELGTVRRGRMSNLPLARRSDSIRVRTDLGRLVVRAYADHWPEESLRHEHALLLHLEAVDYPSTRLVRAPGGDTVLQCDGRRLAAYRFVPGRNLSGSFLGGRLAGAAHDLAGRLLADLHRVTADLHLPGHHHLAMGEADGAGRLDSQLALLQRLASLPSSEHLDGLRERTDEIAERLTRLHTTLMEAAPETAIIHGDFGLHNLLVRSDGSGTVVDFELARRDWCLVDIVEALGSMRPEAGKVFLAGYSRQRGGEPEDWRLLAEMWEYHRLGGAVRAWESYARRGEPGRLDVARRRVAEADRVAANGDSWWR